MEFVPLAEETGLIVPLGVWALEQACRQAVRWHDASPEGPPLSMSVNLSPRQLAEPALPNDVARVLARHRHPAAALWLEITESTLMRDAEIGGRARSARSAALGVHLAVDDFGTGYSSLAVPRAVPGRGAEDRPLVHRRRRASARTAPRSSARSSSLARALRLSTVAEGIETREQLQHLRAMGCEMGQGYLFGPARSPEVFGADPRHVFDRPRRAEARTARPAEVRTST